MNARESYADARFLDLERPDLLSRLRKLEELERLADVRIEALELEIARLKEEIQHGAE